MASYFEKEQLTISERWNFCNPDFPDMSIVFIRHGSPRAIHVTYYWWHIIEDFAVGWSTLLYLDHENPLYRLLSIWTLVA